MTVVEILLLIGVAISLILGVIVLIISDTSRMRARHASDVLDEIREQSLVELERQRLNYSEAQQKIQQLEEERPEQLQWECRRLTKELEQLRQMHSEAQRQIGQQKQEWLHQVEQQERQLLHLEQEHQQLLEELERWRSRYMEAQRQLERLKQERLEDQQKVENLAQMRMRLLAELGEGLREVDKSAELTS